MAAVKLVKSLLIVILFFVQILHLKGMRTNNEEQPDGHIIYDQRQSGQYNIHVVIKDVAIIEMDQNEISDQNYNDEEYYYDEGDLTVKPLDTRTTTSTTSYRPFDSTGDNNDTIITQFQTTIASAESQSVETTTKASQQTFGVTLSANISTNPLDADNQQSRSKVEPIIDAEEIVPESRHHLQSRASKISSNSRIFKVKVQRTHRAPLITTQRERCRSYQYRDGRGNCRDKRSSSESMLKRLFRMLVTLPFKQDKQHNDDENKNIKA